MANIDSAKPWFVTGAYPTQSQFWQLFEWLRWKDEPLTISEITGLQTILNSFTSISVLKALLRDVVNTMTDITWTQPAGVVVTAMVLKSVVNTTVLAGTTPGGDELFEVALTANVPVAVSIAKYAEADSAIYFSGITGQTQIIICKNPV